MLETLQRAGGDLSRCGADGRALVSRVHVADIVRVLYASMTLHHFPVVQSSPDTTPALVESVMPPLGLQERFGVLEGSSSPAFVDGESSHASLSIVAIDNLGEEGGAMESSAGRVQGDASPMRAHVSGVDRGVVPLFNVADDMPSTRLDVLSYAAELLGLSGAPVEPTCPPSASKAAGRQEPRERCQGRAQGQFESSESLAWLGNVAIVGASDDRRHDLAGAGGRDALSHRSTEADNVGNRGEEGGGEGVLEVPVRGRVRGGSKRVHNRKMRALLRAAGLDLQFPDYRRCARNPADTSQLWQAS